MAPSQAVELDSERIVAQPNWHLQVGSVPIRSKKRQNALATARNGRPARDPDTPTLSAVSWSNVSPIMLELAWV